MKKVLLCWLFASIVYSQSPAVEIILNISDNYNWSTSLTIGADVDATDGFDSHFGELMYPPFKTPIPSSFAMLSVGSSYAFIDIKKGPSSPFTGQLSYTIEIQAVDDEPLHFSWTTPPGITSQIIDGTSNGILVNESRPAGSHTLSIRNINSLFNLQYILHFTNVPLPVELVDFYPIISENNVKLKWETATEVNNYGFEVERQFKVYSEQLTDQRWETIGFVEGHGNSNSPKYYSFLDNNLQYSKVKYRLKQIDIDGGFEYSDEIICEIETPGNSLLKQNYPNPFNPQTSIEFTLNEESFVKLNLFNSNGGHIKTLLDENYSAGYHRYLLDINDVGTNLASGVYYYQLTTDNFSSVKKMLILK